jgi:metallophosphoesterase (TIGR00282 family)
MPVKILFLGDIVGRAGRKVIRELLPEIAHKDTIVIANAENAAGGFGITKKVYKELVDMGIHLFTGGNHIFEKNCPSQDVSTFDRLATPSNLPEGRAVHIDIQGVPLSVVNLIGRVFMAEEEGGDPFTTFDEIYERECRGRLVLVDIHAEATSEKIALAEYIGDRAFAVIGTHTHVQTADERILKRGTFFISDVGACCALDSILGMSTAASLGRFVEQPTRKLEVELSGTLMLNAVELTVDNGRVVEFQRVQRHWEQ